MPGSSRATLRQTLADLLGITVRATTSAAGTTTTLVDANRLTQADGFWESHGRNLIITSGTASGDIRQVTTFTASTDTATVLQAFTGAPGASASYEIFHTWTVDELHAAINQAIRRAWPYWYAEQEDASQTTGTGSNRWSVTITAISPEIETKTGYYKVEIEWVTATSTYPYKDWTPFCSLRRDADAFILQFHRLPPESRTIRITYASAPTEVAAESDLTGIDRETGIDDFIYSYARSVLWGMKRGEEAEKERLRWADEADRLIRSKSMKPLSVKPPVTDPELSWLTHPDDDLDDSRYLAAWAV